MARTVARLVVRPEAKTLKMRKILRRRIQLAVTHMVEREEAVMGKMAADKVAMVKATVKATVKAMVKAMDRAVDRAMVKATDKEGMDKTVMVAARMVVLKAAAEYSWLGLEML